MNYSVEVLKQIKEIRERIEQCEDPLEAIMLQTELLEMLKNTLNDEKFKEGLIQRTLNDGIP